MNDILKDLKDKKKTKRDYTLNEDLAIMKMLQCMETNKNITKKKIAELVDRTLPGLNYRYGSDGRGVKQFDTIQDLYKSHGVEPPENIEEDIKSRIEEFKKTLTKRNE